MPGCNSVPCSQPLCICEQHVWSSSSEAGCARFVSGKSPRHTRKPSAARLHFLERFSQYSLDASQNSPSGSAFDAHRSLFFFFFDTTVVVCRWTARASTRSVSLSILLGTPHTCQLGSSSFSIIISYTPLHRLSLRNDSRDTGNSSCHCCRRIFCAHDCGYQVKSLNSSTFILISFLINPHNSAETTLYEQNPASRSHAGCPPEIIQPGKSNPS